MKHRAWIAFSGFLWFFVGCSLLYKGLHLVTQAAFQEGSLCDRMKGFFGSPQQSATALMGLGLLVGFIKGRFILAKTVRRVVGRIASLPLPIRIHEAYSPSYWLLIGLMIVLGMSLRFLPIPIDVRGTIDVAIGSALINGALLYFRAVRVIYTETV